MGRSHRIDPEHGIHHVFSRGTRRWTLFIDELDYQRFLTRLGVVCSRYGIQVYAYCLMGNHFHLAMYCPDGQLSNAMRDLKSVYARQHNHRHQFSGPLFESRFGSKTVTTYEYLRILVRYIHRNPAALDPSAPLELYRWSSHAAYLDGSLEQPGWLDINVPRQMFSGPQDYRRFVESNLEFDKVKLIKSEKDLATRSPVIATRPSVAAILVAVATAAGCSVAQIRPRARNGLIGIVALIATSQGGYSSAELTDACGFSSPQSVRRAKSAARRRLTTDSVLRAIHEKAITKLEPTSHEISTR